MNSLIISIFNILFCLLINILFNKWPNLIPKSLLKSVWKQHFETSLPVSRCDRRASSDHSNWSIVALTAWMRSFCDGPKWTANFLDCPRFESTSDALGTIHILRKYNVGGMGFGNYSFCLFSALMSGSCHLDRASNV
jgi:hypothetical protein